MKSIRSFFICSLAVVASLMFCIAPANANISIEPGYHSVTVVQSTFDALAVSWLQGRQAVIADKRADQLGFASSHGSVGVMMPEYAASYQTHGLSLVDPRRSS